MNAFRTAAIVGHLFLLAFAQGCMSAHAELPEVAVTQHNLRFDGVPAELAGLDYANSASFELDLRQVQLDDLKSLSPDLQIKAITLTVTSGNQDLGFVRDAEISAQLPRQGQLVAVQLLDYHRAADANSTRSLTVPCPSPIEVPEVLFADRVPISVAVAGALPASSWTADVTLHLSARYDWDL